MTAKKTYYAPYFPTDPITAGHEIVRANDLRTSKSELDALREELATQDRVLRASVPEKHKYCTSPAGSVQSYIVELEGRNESLASLIRESLEAMQDLGERNGIKRCRELAQDFEKALQPTEPGENE